MKKTLVLLLLVALLIPALALAQGETPLLTVEEAQYDGMVVHVGIHSIESDNLGIVRFIELLPDVWIKVASETDISGDQPVTPLDDSGSFIVEALSSEPEGGEKTLLAVHYFLMDLDALPAADQFGIETVQEMSLADALVEPATASLAEALEQLPQVSDLYPELLP